MHLSQVGHQAEHPAQRPALSATRNARKDVHPPAWLRRGHNFCSSGGWQNQTSEQSHLEGPLVLQNPCEKRHSHSTNAPWKRAGIGEACTPRHSKTLRRHAPHPSSIAPSLARGRAHARGLRQSALGLHLIQVRLQAECPTQGRPQAMQRKISHPTASFRRCRSTCSNDVWPNKLREHASAKGPLG